MNAGIDSLFGFLPNLGPTELIVILVIGIILFGKRLPEVGRSLGKGIVEFKKGLRGVEDEIDESSSSRSDRARSDERAAGASSPKFDVPPDSEG
ncbi:twin arginine translocase protein A [Planctomycetes bacterium Pan216]|uniref:Sec-independent protein translocase protein TatA n=1 Tax=Kolteria novifilia TaxID=2527975 RepID=A0A518B156_9BACT|nr:twin arginine translocase protein A [Planctomycetes bacterium Pan216]